MTLELKEKFSWMAPEFKVMDSGKNTIRIRGVALKGNVVSRNKRRYVADALNKSAYTWIGKPVTINHDMTRKVGDVKWMEYEDGALEYLADIKKQPYVDMLRNKSADIRGVSIEAAYLHNQCPRCNEKFYTEEDFHKHMHDEHFIKTDPTLEPHGIIGQALSLVLSPEEPGYSGTSIDLMEMYEKPVLRLLETVITTEKEKTSYMKAIKGKAAITPTKRITMHTAVKLKEQEDDHGCAENEHWNSEQGKCVPNEVTEQEDHGCAEDEYWSEEEGKCVKKEVTEQDEGTVVSPEPVVNVGEPPTLEPACPEGFHREGEACVPDEPPAMEPELPAAPMPVIPAETPPVEAPVVEPSVTMEQDATGVHDCPPDSHWDVDAQTCVPDDLPEEPTAEPVQVAEVKLPTLLKLGEPFADYTSHADCVAKNPDKEDADAYCASIKRKVEGESVKETYHPDMPYIRDMRIASAVNMLNEAVAKISKDTMLPKRLMEQEERFSKRCEALSKRISGEGKLRHAYDRAQAKHIYQELGKHRSEEKHLVETANEKTMKYIKEKLTPLATDSMNLTAKIKDVSAKLTELEGRNKSLEAKMDEKTRVFEKTLALADKNNVDLREHLKTLEQRVREQEEAEPEACPEGQHRNEAGECVPDEPAPATVETEKRLEEMTVKLENLEAKITGQFKGRSPELREIAVKEHPEDPNKPIKKKRQG